MVISSGVNTKAQRSTSVYAGSRAIDKERSEYAYERVQGAEDNERNQSGASGQNRRQGIGRSKDPIDRPRLAPHLRGKPAGQDGDEGQGKAQEGEPQEGPVLLEAALAAQVRSDPGERQHEQTAPDHDSEGNEGNDHRRPVCAREVGQSDLFGVKAQAPDQTA
jgi:hypothetical protein